MVKKACITIVLILFFLVGISVGNISKAYAMESHIERVESHIETSTIFVSF